MIKPLHLRLSALRSLACLLAIGTLFGWTSSARAKPPSPSPPCTAASSPYTIDFGNQNIAVPSSTPVGATIGSKATVQANFSCTDITAAQSPVTFIAGQLGNNPTVYLSGLLYTTNRTGVGLYLTVTNAGPSAPTVTATALTLGTVAGTGAGSSPLTVTFTAQLVRIAGTIAPGAIGGINLSNQIQYTPNSGSAINFAGTTPTLKLTSNTATITAPTCTVNAPNNFTVTLPTISSTALAGGMGATAGATAFNLTYTCPTPGTTVTPSMKAGGPRSGTTGLIMPTPGPGFATNVGLQLLSGDGSPVDVTGGTQTPVVSSGTTLSLLYYVQYYQTAATITIGNVTGTVTYTLTYQ